MSETEPKNETAKTDDAKANKKASRRKFLVRGGLGTLGVLAIGTYVGLNPMRRAIMGMIEKMVPPYSGKGTEPQLWFEVTKDNQVLVHSSKVEMGQGTFTGSHRWCAMSWMWPSTTPDSVSAATTWIWSMV
ncbi:MAG: hypothetical protein AAFU85_23150, partial [Planctomycetota bacterium]